MAIIQANAAPITNKDALQTVTLKNIVALDVIEKNEALLKAFNLLDDSETKLNIFESTLTVTRLKELIEKIQSELPNDINEELKTYRAMLSQERTDNEDIKIIELLSSESLSNEIPKDNTDEILKQFQKKNNFKIFIDYDKEQYNYTSIDGSYLKSKLSEVYEKK